MGWLEQSGVPLPAGNIPANEGLGSMTLRIGLFMLAILIFMFTCGYAWKTIPALKRLVPGPKPEEETKANRPPLIYLRPVEKIVEKVAVRPGDALAQALSDGQPGSVVHAASNLEDGPSPSDIIIAKRED